MTTPGGTEQISLLGAARIRQLAAELDLRPTKTLGQNFVHDANTVRRIVSAAALAPDDHVLEVGPGLGSLTLGLLEKVDRVTVVEIDPRLAGLLPRTVAEQAPGRADRLRVVCADALTVGAAEVGEPTALVANLPYNVSVPVLLHLLAELPSLRRVLVMVQAEVADRLAAGPGSRTYGVPSVKAAWYGTVKRAGSIGRHGVLARTQRRLGPGLDRPARGPHGGGSGGGVHRRGPRVRPAPQDAPVRARRLGRLRCGGRGAAGAGRYRSHPSGRDTGRGRLSRDRRGADVIGALPSATVRVRVPAKINLHLGVGELRPDGYHELVTVFQAVSLFDEVALTPADELSVVTHGATGVPAGAANLAGRAVLLLAEHAGRHPGVRIEITKQIPVAGGMAGGSADAAAALLGCAQLWQLDLTRSELMTLAAELGSDVPFALAGGTAVGTGRGEQIAPVLTRHQWHWVLAIADGGLSTPAVFGELDRLRAAAPAPAGRSGGGGAGRVGPPRGRRVGRCTGKRHAGRGDLAATLAAPGALRRRRRGGAELSGQRIRPDGGDAVPDADHASDVAARVAGLGVCRTVRVVNGPVPGARLA